MFSYKINKNLVPEEIRDKVFEYSVDHETTLFIEHAKNNPIPKWKYRLFAFLCFFMDIYDAHARVGMYKMRLLSKSQWKELSGGGKKLLDVGAGQGFITEEAKDVFEDIAVNELYFSMRKRLKRKGFRIVEGDFEDGIDGVNEKFDVVSLLNVIDRCDKPLTLIRNCRYLLSDGGRLIIADPLPFKSAVLKRRHNGKPKETLPVSESKIWEECFTLFYNEVIKKNGLVVERLTRLPYLSESEIHSDPIVSLDDMVVVCRKG
jgi:SAM-dependent methyltransferase